MIKIKNILLGYYRKTTGSIAFLPAFISILMALLAILVLIAERYGVSDFLKKHFDVLFTYSVESARTILSVLIGGIFSLTVFSFSMVMILISQASSYFSPRVIPGLISNKSHQYVLGTYLGTILFCLLILINIYKPANDEPLPGLGVLVAVLLGIICLGLFVYFIHSISTAIQASNVLYKLFRDTRHDLEIMLEEERRQISLEDDEGAPSSTFPIYSNKTGYLQSISETSLLNLAVEHDTVLRMEVTRGMFVLKNVPIANSSVELDEETAKAVLSCFQFSNRELVRINYLLGFKQITEVAVKAMSPGINDPGTALTAIDFLTELLAIRMMISDVEIMEDKDGKQRVHFNTVSFSDLVYNILASLRQYTKHDTVIIQKLLTMMKYLLLQKNSPQRYLAALKSEVSTLLEDAEMNIENERDLDIIKKLAQALTE